MAVPLETFQLGPFPTVPRLWNGLWQLSSNAWGSAPASRIRSQMGRYVEQGYTAFADHYGSAELLFGEFRKTLDSPDRVLCATKWCVFRHIQVTRASVEAAVQERLERTQSESVDLLQFHWQDYDDTSYLAALRHLVDLRNEGKIGSIGLCNFDTVRTREICEELGPDVIVSNQVQFSLIDTRPLNGMTDVCEIHNVKLLTYGTLCGGFLADSWLNKPEPDLYSGHLTPSQRKYLDMIMKVWGDWELFQSLLSVLRSIGDRHDNASIANIATRWVLDQPAVGAVIVGARLGVSEHRENNLKVMSLRLDDEDRTAIQQVLDRSNGPRLMTSIGDCGAEYR